MTVDDHTRQRASEGWGLSHGSKKSYVNEACLLSSALLSCHITVRSRRAKVHPGLWESERERWKNWDMG